VHGATPQNFVPNVGALTARIEGGIEGGRTGRHQGSTALRKKPFELPVACLIKKSDYNVIASLFAEYDTNHDKRITRDEFEEMALKTYEKLPVFSQKSVRESLSPHLDLLWSSLGKLHLHGITLAQFIGIFYPHISKRDIARCLKAYGPHPRRSRTSQEKLRAVPGAAEELREIFEHWDKNGDGLVTWTELESPLHRAGVALETAKGWLREARVTAGTEDQRSSDELTLGDVEAVFCSNYVDSPIPNSPRVECMSC